MNRILATLALSGALFASVLPAFAQESPAPQSSSPATAPARKERVAVFHLSGTLTERPQSFGLSLDSLMGGGTSGPALSDLINRLNAATKDSAIKGVFLDCTAFSLTLNQAQEIGSLLTGLKKAGKRVAIYSADYDAGTYALATYADTIIMPEQGDVMIPGVGMQMIFFAGTLEKLNLSADFVQVGKFKGAEEPFTRKSASPEYRAQIEKLVDGMYAQLVGTIATNRPNLTQDQVKKIIDEAWFTGKRAKEVGLVDQTIARGGVDKWINDQFPSGATMVDDYGMPKKETIDLSSPLAVLELFSGSAKPRGSSAPAVAVIYATGEITGDSGGAMESTEIVTPGMIRKALKTALADSKVKAIVLRVDSPGGSAAASDEIWAMLKEADKTKPVTVSMGQIAASGGYYIACAGRTIMADPATITGSIGVVGGKVVIKGALDWAGLNIEPIQRGAHSEMLSALRPFSDEERVFMRKQMEEVYGVFTSRVSAARGEKVAKLDEVAQGRLFTGQQAKDVGLVDEVGTLNDAVRAAARKANIDTNYQMLILPEPKTLNEILTEALSADSGIRPAAVPTASFRLDATTAMISALPAEVRQPTRQALRMLHSLDQNRIMLTMPAGIVEMHSRRK
jgi:protease IV